jgi:hypothetical protein
MTEKLAVADGHFHQFPVTHASAAYYTTQIGTILAAKFQLGTIGIYFKDGRIC